jgi:DNA-binding response OmpR family regulator
MANILICDDDADIVRALKIYLGSEDYVLFTASNGREALDIIRSEPIELVLLDIMMPELDGIAVTAKLREEASAVPIILLTAKSELADKVLGLTVGADDYVTKPFDPVELQARVRSQLRRYLKLGGLPESPSCSVIGGLVLDDAAKTLTVDGEDVSLTPLEFAILRLLMRHPGKVFSSVEIYEQVWQEEALGAEGTVAVHIRHLREKIEINPSVPRYVKVVWGQGYKLGFRS